MSQQTLATVSIDLVANNAAFLSGLSKTEASLKNSVKAMGSTISNFGSALSQTLGSVGGSIGTELSGVFTGIGSAVSDMASKISAAKGVTGALSIAVGGLAAVGIAAAASLAGLALSGAEMAESLSLTSQKTGISIRDLQTLQAAGGSVGLSLEGITTAMRKFSGAIVGTGKGGKQLDDTMKSLGVTSHDSNEALLQIADAFQKMPDGPLKAAYAVELFGRSGLDMIPLLDKGRDGLKEFSDIVDQFGPNVDKNAVAAMDNWHKSTEKLSLAWDSFKVSLGGGVGILAHLVDGIARATKGFGDMAGTLLKNPLAGLGALANGGLGGLSVLSGANNPPANPNEGAAKRAAVAAEQALIAKQQELFEITAAGGAAEYALAQKKEKIQEKVQAGDYAHALTLQSELPALEEAADKEKQRAAAAKALVKEHERLLDLITKQGEGKIHVSNPTRPFPVVAAPDIQTTAQQFNDIGESLQNLGRAAGVTSAVLQQGKDAVADFYTTWDRDNKKTVDVINQKFDDELKNFQGLMTLQAISQEQFNEVSKDLENQRLAEIQRAQAEQGTNFAASFGEMFSQIVNDGDAMAKHLSDSVGGAIKDLTSQVTQFAVTGKANFASVGKSLESSVVQSGLNKLTSSAVKGIGGVFGVKFPGAKADGSSQNPFYVRNADHSIGDKVSGAQPLGDIGSKIGDSLKGSLGSLGSSFGKLFGGGGLGSLFGSLGGLFGGFLADGGDVTPGRAYIVGEKQPELFMPRAAGTIMPSVHGGSGGSGGRPIQVNAHFHGVTDVDTFKSSKNQILNHLASQVSRAVSRR